MADFLLLNKDNWMDSLKPTELLEYQAKYPESWTEKYNSRNGRYDIIECKPDGFYKDHQHGDGQFLILHVPGLSVEEGGKNCGSVHAFGGLDPEGNPQMVLQHKNKCRLKFANLPANIRNALNRKFVYTISLADFQNFKTSYVGTKGVDI